MKQPPRRVNAPTHSSGFTLIELLVAMAVFSTLAVMAYIGLAQIVRSRESIDAVIEQQLAARRWMSQLEADFEQAIASPGRSQYGEREAALFGSNSEVWLSVQQLGAVEGELRSRVVRVHVRRSGPQLLREQLLHNPPGNSAEADRRELSDGVRSFELRYLDRRLEPQNQWPPIGSARLDELPRAIEMRIDVDGLGPLRRVFELPESVNAAL